MANDSVGLPSAECRLAGKGCAHGAVAGASRCLPKCPAYACACSLVSQPMRGTVLRSRVARYGAPGHDALRASTRACVRACVHNTVLGNRRCCGPRGGVCFDEDSTHERIDDLPSTDADPLGPASTHVDPESKAGVRLCPGPMWTVFRADIDLAVGRCGRGPKKPLTCAT